MPRPHWWGTLCYDDCCMSICLSVSLSVCLSRVPDPKLRTEARRSMLEIGKREAVTPFRGRKVIYVKVKVMPINAETKIRHIFGTERSANFKLGTRME